MIYTYYCEKCEKENDFFHGMNETPTFVCECGSVMKKKITGGCGVIYKGVGWPRKGTGTSPKPKRYIQHELVGPKFLRNAIKK
jgi:predicted nucleic acid-binding Zn ribbon protein